MSWPTRRNTMTLKKLSDCHSPTRSSAVRRAIASGLMLGGRGSDPELRKRADLVIGGAGAESSRERVVQHERQHDRKREHCRRSAADQRPGQTAGDTSRIQQGNEDDETDGERAQQRGWPSGHRSARHATRSELGCVRDELTQTAWCRVLMVQPAYLQGVGGTSTLGGGSRPATSSDGSTPSPAAILRRLCRLRLR